MGKNTYYKSYLGNLSIAKELELEDNNIKNKTIYQKLYSALLFILTVAIVIFILSLKNQHANAASRIKDIVYFEGIRENLLIGYGLVVGLNGSGDNLKNSPFTEKGLAQFLSRLGVSTKGTNLKTKNVAAVTITATLPPFSRSGNKIDVKVSTLGDAKSLKGGTLLATPLLGADGNVYAVAQGAISLGGIVSTKNTANTLDKSVPTNGLIANGAIIEKEIHFDLNKMQKLKLALRNPDISTARRISDNINDIVGEDAAIALDPGTVELTVPEIYGENVVGLLADIEQIIIEPDQVAQIIIDEASGTIVIGEEVKVDTIAVAQGNLLVTINSQSNSDETGAFTSDSQDAGAILNQVSNNNNPGNGLAILRQGASLKDLVSGLNALGVGTRDLITILETIKAAGALHANIQIR